MNKPELNFLAEFMRSLSKAQPEENKEAVKLIIKQRKLERIKALQEEVDSM